jgi:ATP-dependent Clp protease, protease subunit
VTIKRNSRLQPIDIPAGGLVGRRGRMFARAPGSGFRADHNVLEIFDEIGADGVTLNDVTGRLRAMTGQDIVVRLNSPGGLVDVGLAVFNSLVQHQGKVTAEVIGVAASAASVIAMAADEIKIAPGAFIMAHEVFGLTIGNAGDHDKHADTLRKFDSVLAKIYAARTGNPIATIVAVMAAETWYSGAEAVRAGFADALLEAPAKVINRFDLTSVYNRVPATLLKAPDVLPTNVHVSSALELQALLRTNCGLSHGASRKIATAGFAALGSTPHSDIETIKSFEARIAQAKAEIINI